MVALFRIIFQLVVDTALYAIQQLCSTRWIEAENPFLRPQWPLFKERGIKPQRVDAATRISLAVLSQLFDSRDALVIVPPKTIIRWQREGCNLYWRWKCRLGWPRIPVEFDALIRRMAHTIRRECLD